MKRRSAERKFEFHKSVRLWPASSLPKSGEWLVGGALAESIYTLIANGTLTFSLGERAY